jgi:hypothetical protein
MRSEKLLPRILLFSGMAGLLVMAFIFDFILNSLQVENVGGAGYEPVLVLLFPAFALVLVLGALGLFWYQFSSGDHSRAVGVVFSVVGLLLLFATPLLFFLPVPMSVYAVVQFVQPYSYAFLASALLAGSGLLSLFLKKP